MSYDERPDFAEKRKFISEFFDMLRLHCASDFSAWHALEVGGEGGVLAGLMAQSVSTVIVTDIINAQITYGGDFMPLLRDKFERMGERLPIGRVEFVTADAQDLMFRDRWFDLCFSQNVFEHIPDPEAALRELLRVTKRGGFIYLMFDPIWTADSGSHFLHRIGRPWAHLIEDDDVIAGLMKANAASEAEITSYLDHMNRLPLSYYQEMFPRVIHEAGAELLIHHVWSGCVDEVHLQDDALPLAAEKLGVPTDDLLVRGMRYLIRV